MNRNDRTSLAMRTRRLYHIIKEEVDLYNEYISALIDGEEAKLSNIPDSLQNSTRFEDIQEGIELLEDMRDKSEELPEIVDDMASIYDIDITKGKIAVSNNSFSYKENNVETKSKHVHVMLTESLLDNIRQKANDDCNSVNEVVNKSLKMYLELKGG